jgi:hypothetical protein
MAKGMTDGAEKTELLQKIEAIQQEAGPVAAGNQPKAPGNPPTAADKQPSKAATSRKKYVSTKMLVIVGLALFLLSGIFPPWDSVIDSQGVHLQKDLGYHLLFEPPTANGRYSSSKIDFSRLGLQWFLIACTTGVVLFLRRPTLPSEE